MKANAYPYPIGPAWMDENGYWRICIRGKDGRWKMRYLHRVIYEQAHGPIPPGYGRDDLTLVAKLADQAHTLIFERLAELKSEQSE